MGLDSSDVPVDLGVMASEVAVALGVAWLCANGDSGGDVLAGVPVLLRSSSAGCRGGGTETSGALPEAAMLCTHRHRP